MGRKLLGALLGVGLLLGMKFYNKSASHDEAKAQLLALCEGEAACVQAVEQNFEACFDAAYKTGGRRQASRLAAGELVKCLNGRSGKAYFAMADGGGQ